MTAKPHTVGDPGKAHASGRRFGSGRNAGWSDGAHGSRFDFFDLNRFAIRVSQGSIAMGEIQESSHKIFRWSWP